MRKQYTIITLALIMAGSLLAGCEMTGNSTGGHAILLATFNDPQYHVEAVNYWLESAKEQTRWRNLFVVHEEGQSMLYCGTYSSLPKAQDRLARARKFRTRPTPEAPEGVAVFTAAKIVPAPGVDLGPAEWQLKNHTGGTRYTLVVAQFHSQPGYKEPHKYALEYCRQLRAEGESAYLHHTQAMTFVTLGNFPESSYQMVTQRRNAEPGMHLGIATPCTADPALQRILNEFPELAINGRRSIIRRPHQETGEMVETPDHSFIMEIPSSRGQYAQ